MKILIVDDSPTDRRLYRILLEETFGAQVAFSEARNAEVGLAACRAGMPDCVLLDYKLPDMSGLEFLAQLNADCPAGVPPCAVVMLTGLGSEKVAAEAMKAGAQDYLVKDQINAQGLMLAVEKASEKVKLLAALATERDGLAASVAEKEILLKEVHHRVKNNLQVIASLLRLQGNALKDQGVKDALQECQHRVESMALIHEQLYQAKTLREVDMAAHIRTLVANLAHSYAAEDRQIRCTVRVHPFSLGLDHAIPVGLILNELTTNALKHAFPLGRGGSVDVSATREANGMRLAVKDNGVGIPGEMLTGEPRTFGLQIVTVLTRQIKGTFEIKSGHGTTCRLTVALPGETNVWEREHEHIRKHEERAQQEHAQGSAGGR